MCAVTLSPELAKRVEAWCAEEINGKTTYQGQSKG